MSFEKFDRKSSKSFVCKVTISKIGTMRFNSVCMNEIIKDKKFIDLYYDKKECVIACQLTDNYDNSFRISKSTSGHAGVISCKGFMRYFGIDFKKNIAISPYVDKQTNRILIKLPKCEFKTEK